MSFFRALDMPSLQAKHSRLCALGRPWTTFDGALVGCTCAQGPIYYVVVRDGEQAHREVVGRDRQQAELALLRVEDSVENGDFRPRPNIGLTRSSVSRRQSLPTVRRSSTLRRRSVAGASAESGPKTSSASTWSYASEVARP